MSQIATLEASLSTLLGKSRDDPWSLLMIQTLLWSFRRWAIFYLTSDELTNSMAEFLWESHFNLVDRFAPEGLRDFAIIWLNPANVGDRAEMLEELNQYFVSVVTAFDISINMNDDALQNELADFIDERITALIDNWLQDREYYRIYPAAGESSDNFSSATIFEIMQTIMKRYITTSTPPVTKEEVPAAVEEVPAAVEEVPAAVEEPPAAVEEVPAAVEEVPQPQPQPQPPPPTPTTIAEALNRRRTMRKNGRDLRKSVKTTRKKRL